MNEAACAGKTFEHHVSIEQEHGETWRCRSCHTTGTVKEVNDQLWPLMLRAETIQNCAALIPVILMPSESPPGLIGQFRGYDLYRVQGIDRPMVAAPGLGG